MTSVIMYGRNDNHGYNYHKRVAISLNCISEVLTSKSDEIIFVDCNSPDGFPSLPQAIQDTLTTRTKKILKIIRVRENPGSGKYLPISESISRNIAIRRSNPDNRWILSTNTDMILIPKDEIKSLSDIFQNLPDGFYQLPRFAIPENFWEQSFDRLRPDNILNFLRSNGRNFQLNTIVRRPGFLLFDNPGDFQLILRKDIIDLGGFNEEMHKGWHVDANLCKRMQLHGKTAQSLEDIILAYHCNHNLKESLFSKKTSENDWEKFVSKVKSAKINQSTWGLSKQSFEVLSLESAHQEALKNALVNFKNEPTEIIIQLSTFNKFSYNPGIVIPYLVDLFLNMPKKSSICYVGYNQSVLDALCSYFESMNIEGLVFYESNFCSSSRKKARTIDQSIDISSIYATVFDYGFDFHIGRMYTKNHLWQIYKLQNHMKKEYIAKGYNTRFIGLNILHTDFFVLFIKDLHQRKSDYSTGVTCGILSPKFARPQMKRIQMLQYIASRYFFDHCDALRNFIVKNYWCKKILKSFQ